MKLVSWNVNGLRACVKKGFSEFVDEIDADVICVQETKMQREQSTFEFPGYDEYWNSAEKKGYSGTAIFTRVKPLNVIYDMGIEEHDKEGRVIAAEFEKFYLVTVYTPNSKRKLERLEYRMIWEDDFQDYVDELNKKKPVIVCGDLNVAAEEIDLKNDKSNHKSAGFTDEERSKFRLFKARGYVDSFRYLHPDEIKYSWWSYMFKARQNNAGWRIDYFLTSEVLKEKILETDILTEVFGSDHCPVLLKIDL